MPVIVDTPEYQVIETVTENGKTTEFRWKPGSPGANRETIEGKARQALTTNASYLAQPAIPGGTLTAAQLGAALRIVRTQVDALTRENNAIIRLLLGALDDVSGT